MAMLSRNVKGFRPDSKSVATGLYSWIFTIARSGKTAKAFTFISSKCITSGLMRMLHHKSFMVSRYSTHRCAFEVDIRGSSLSGAIAFVAGISQQLGWYGM
jgi:hypothetical protein